MQPDLTIQIQERIAAGWVSSGITLSRQFVFLNFAQALSFVDLLGAEAEAHNHHPDIAFGWGYCSVVWSTHSAGGITERDIEMSKISDTLFQSVQ